MKEKCSFESKGMVNPVVIAGCVARHQMIQDPPAVTQQHRIDGELNTQREDCIFLTLYHFFHGFVVPVAQASFHQTQSCCVVLAKDRSPRRTIAWIVSRV